MACTTLLPVSLPPCAAASLHVDVVAGREAFLQMEPLWTQIVKEAAVRHPFAEHLWASTWLECFGAGSEPYILLVTAGSRPIGIAPLLRSVTRIGGIPIRRLGFFYNDHVPRADFIIADRATEVYAAIWAHLRADNSWDVLQLCQIPEGTPTLTELTDLAARDGCAAHVWHSGVSPYVPMTTTWIDYLASVPAKHRSNLRNRFKRLRALGPLDVSVIDSSEGLPQALEDGVRLEAAAWKGQAGTAIQCQPEVARFYTLLAERTAERGWLRLHFLESGARRIAFDLSLEYGQRMFLLKVGYEPEYAAFSPSNLLVYEALRASFERGGIEYDFLGEFMDWKRQWARQGRANSWLYVFSNHWRARAACALKFHLLPWLKRSPFWSLRASMPGSPA